MPRQGVRETFTLVFLALVKFLLALEDNGELYSLPQVLRKFRKIDNES